MTGWRRSDRRTRAARSRRGRAGFKTLKIHLQQVEFQGSDSGALRNGTFVVSVPMPKTTAASPTTLRVTARLGGVDQGWRGAPGPLCHPPGPGSGEHLAESFDGASH